VGRPSRCDDKALRAHAKATDGTADPELAHLHRWIVRMNANGVISRQELVSMIPVALLAIEPSHTVLDMCASPGSKTTQALEMLHASKVSPSGFVIANEMVCARSFVLARRCAALGEACARLAVTSHRAQIFPSADADGDADGGYDRIICDVPCSGDGTFRKYRDKWAHWRPHMGRQLHSIQLQIALRAAHLLKTGGVMTYSTCSLNPLENEAVVAQLILRAQGA
jgi:16S rRNA C967 or C1407 C5-methylase (RsmB/RsmF family)